MMQVIIYGYSFICGLKEVAKNAKIRSLQKFMDIWYVFKIQFDLITTVYFYFLFLDYFCTKSNELLKFVYSNCMDTDFETGWVLIFTALS